MTSSPEKQRTDTPADLDWLQWAAPLAVALITLIVFWPTVNYGFVEWDDPVEVTANPHIEGLSTSHLHWMFTNVDWVRRYQPLDWVSWAINYQLHGRKPFGYHLGNVLQHAACALLLYFLLLKLLRVWTGTEPQGLRPTVNPQGTLAAAGAVGGVGGLKLNELLMICAAAGALAWSIHPLRAECVAWVTGRIYTQCALFLFACFLCYVHAVDPTAPRPRRLLLHALAVLFFICSLLSYATVVGAALALLLLDIFPLRRFRGESPNRWFNRDAIAIYLEKLPYLAGAAAVGFVTIWARLNVSQAWTPPPTLAQFSLFARIMQAFYTYAYYLWIPFKPVHYLPVYTRLVGFDPVDQIFLLSAALVIAVTVLAWVLRKKMPWIAVAWGFHLLMLFPYLGLTEYPHYTNDRYAHFQGILFSALLAGGLVCLFKRYGLPAFRGTMLILGVVLVALAALCHLHGSMWQDSEKFFQTMIVELGDDPYRGDIFWRLGDHYSKTGRVPEALEAFDQSIKISPQLPQPRQMKANLLIKLGQAARAGNAPPDQVRQVFLEAARTLDDLAKRRPSPDTIAVAADAYAEAGDFPAALQRLEAVTQAIPENPDFRLRYARVLAQSGKREEAMAQLEAAMNLSPQLRPHRTEIIESWGNAPATGTPSSSQPATTRAR